jgi:large subunit ribosomal protein L41
MTHFTPEQMAEQPFGRLPPGGITGQIYLDYARGKKSETDVALNADGEIIS